MTLYTDHPLIAVPLMPGQYGRKRGFVYAIFCAKMVVKIGASCNPRARIREQCGGGHLSIWTNAEETFSDFGVRKILLSDERDDFRILERNIHRLLFPFRVRPTKEHYRLEKHLADAITAVFEGDFSIKAQAVMADVIRAEVNSWRSDDEEAA